MKNNRDKTVLSELKRICPGVQYEHHDNSIDKQEVKQVFDLNNEKYVAKAYSGKDGLVLETYTASEAEEAISLAVHLTILKYHSFRTFKFSGNSSFGSKPIIVYDNKLKAEKGLLIALYSLLDVTKECKNFKPFVDRMFFLEYVEENVVRVRHYQLDWNCKNTEELKEIGPYFEIKWDVQKKDRM